MLRLSDFAALGRYQLVRDGDFANPGYINSGVSASLVPVKSAFHVADALEAGAVAMIASPEAADSVPKGIALGISTNPVLSLFQIHRSLAQTPGHYWTDFPTAVGDCTRVDAGAIVAQDNVRIGRGCVVEAGAVILPRSVLGDGVVIRSGAVIGSIGLEVKRLDGVLAVMPHVGGVEIGACAEVQANAVVEAGLFQPATVIGPGSVIAARALVAHSCRLGAECVIGAAATVCGSTRMGDGVVIGAGAIVSNSLRICSGASVGMGECLKRSLGEGMVYYQGRVISQEKLASLRGLAERKVP